MAGPVWKRRDDESTSCDLCLREVDHAYVEGEVVDGSLVISRRLCESCYRENIHMIQHTPSPIEANP